MGLRNKIGHPVHNQKQFIIKLLCFDLITVRIQLFALAIYNVHCFLLQVCEKHKKDSKLQIFFSKCSKLKKIETKMTASVLKRDPTHKRFKFAQVVFCCNK